MLVKVPHNPAVVRAFGPYPSRIDLLAGTETAVQRHVRRGGLAGFEPETQATLLTLVQLAAPPIEFFDIGAHVGLFSCLLPTVFPSLGIRVTAFEPTPATADLNRRVAAANAIEVQLEQRAVAEEEGSTTLYISDKAESSNSLAEGFRPSSESVTVDVATVDAYCSARGRRPTVIKIDVETYEAQVLQGALGTIDECRPAIVCELLPAADRTRTDTVLRRLEELGYHAHQLLAGSGWVECEPSEVFEHIGRRGRNWLFTPDALDTAFHDAYSAWLTAIAACTVKTNRNAWRRGPDWNVAYGADEQPGGRFSGLRRLLRRR